MTELSAIGYRYAASHVKRGQRVLLFGHELRVTFKRITTRRGGSEVMIVLNNGAVLGWEETYGVPRMLSDV